MNFRNLLIASAGASAALMIAGAAEAANTITSSAGASISLIGAISLTKNSDLSFGEVVIPTSSSAVVTVAASSGAVVTSTDTAVHTAGSGPAKFTFVGTTAGDTFNNVSAGSSVTLSDGNSHTLTLTPAIALTGTTGSGPYQVAGATAPVLYVGGSITIPTGATAAAYTGTVNVSLTYP